MAKLVVFLLVAWNILVLLLFGWDKKRAIRGSWRIRQSFLLWLALAGAGPGAWAGMLIFRHKTRKLVFRLLVPLAALGQLILFHQIKNYLN